MDKSLRKYGVGVYAKCRPKVRRGYGKAAKHLIFLGSRPYFAPGIVFGVHGVPTFCESIFMVICWPLIDMIIVTLE